MLPIQVGTPGRLKDFLVDGLLSLDHLRFLVLDEADRMLDMGFLEDVEDIIKHRSMPAKEKRQSLMYSATFPDKIQDIARSYLSDYLFLRVGIVGAANTDITQSIIRVNRYEKREKLIDILQDLMAQNQTKILIFIATKKMTDFIGSFLSQQVFIVYHYSSNQKQMLL